MGLDNRDYLKDEGFRYSSGGSFSAGAHAPMCRRILIVTIAVFVLQIFSVRDWNQDELRVRRDQLMDRFQQSQTVVGDDADQVTTLEEIPLNPTALGLPPKVSVVQNWLQLETPKVLTGQVWRLVSCAFCHDRHNLLHILFNMLFLWWFGPRLEAMYGSKEFLLFYLTAAVVASISYIGLDLATGSPVPMVGASGAVMGVLTLFAMHFPTTIIYVMFIIPVEIRWIVLLYAIFDLHPVLLSLAGEDAYDSVAHAAHLGGLAFGYIYGKQQLRLLPLVSNIDMWWKKKRRGFRVVGGDGPREPSARSRKLADEMDAILQKISEHGEASLTSAERKTLERASRELRDRRQ